MCDSDVSDVSCKCVCGCIVRCQQAAQACTVYPFQTPPMQRFPLKAVCGVAELSLKIELLLVLEIKKQAITSGNNL